MQSKMWSKIVLVTIVVRNLRWVRNVLVETVFYYSYLNTVQNVALAAVLSLQG